MNSQRTNSSFQGRGTWCAPQRGSTAPGKRIGLCTVFMLLFVVGGLFGILPAGNPFISQAYAQSQNEVQISVIYDGTPGYTTPDGTNDFDSWQGAAPQPHTPGSDAGAQNGVVRTHDQYAMRIDWNVNEEATTNVVLTVVLPDHSIWLPDETGMFGGCAPLPTSSISTDGHTLTCHIDKAEQEGSHGAVRAIALLQEELDNSTFNVGVTMTTDDDTTGVTDDLDVPLTVSEAPSVNWVKQTLSTSNAVTVSGEEGYVVLYGLSMLDFSQSGQTRGVGPVNDSLDVSFFDHFWQQEDPALGVPNAILATSAHMAAAGLTGRAPCGKYDGADNVLPATTGTWTCGAATTGAGGYPVVPVTITGSTSRPFPTVMSDGTTANAQPIVHAGQIAFWLPKADVDAAIADIENAAATISAIFRNTISNDDDTFNVQTMDQAQGDIAPIPVGGTSGYAVAEATPDNTATVSFGASVSTSTGGSGSGGTIQMWNNIQFYNGPLALLEQDNYLVDDGTVLQTTDIRSEYWLPGSNVRAHGRPPGTTTDYIGQTPRSNTLLLDIQIGADSSGGGDAPLHGCVAMDNTHYEVMPIGQIPVTQISGPTAYSNLNNVGGYVLPGPNAGPAANIFTGPTGQAFNYSEWGQRASYDKEVEIPYIIEFTDAPVEYGSVSGGFGADHNSLTCNGDGSANNGDAGPSGWVDSVSGDLSVFDTDNDGTYDAITRMRVRTTERFEWNAQPAVPGLARIGMRVNLQLKVKSDLNVQTAGQELFAMVAHSYGELDANGVPDMVRYVGQMPDNRCHYRTSRWSETGNTGFTSTGWCNHRFMDDGTGSLDTTDLVDWDASAGQGYLSGNLWGPTSGTVAQIVTARLGVSKSNLDGANDITDNEDLVQFRIRPSVVGSNFEALTNVRLRDDLPSYYHFVRFVTQPTSPGASCNAPATPDGVIACQFSEPNPAVDTGDLPVALAGGWSDEFIIEVEVVDAIAQPDRPTGLVNTAIAYASGIGSWDPVAGDFTDPVQASNTSKSGSAASYMPLASAEGAIVKSLGALDGPCVTHPTEDPVPADWDTNCQMVDYEQNITYTLSVNNHGNQVFTNVRFVDVFPYNGDGTEPASNTENQSSSLPNTLGDGRTPNSDFAGTIAFVGVTGANTIYVTGDSPATVSRDPNAAELTNTWCTDTADNSGTVVFGTGSCPADNTAVTAVMAILDGPVNPGQTGQVTLDIIASDYECDDIWTNTSGLRVDEILLPIRSPDVSVMPGCLLRVGGLLWEDENNDELADASDTHTTFAGVEVHLYDSSGTQVATTTSNASGEYLFENLLEGEYQVRIPDTAANQTAFAGFASSGGADHVDGQVDTNNNTDNDDNGYADTAAGFLFSSRPVTLSHNSALTVETDGINGLSDDETDANAADGTTPAYPDDNSNLSIDFGFVAQVDLSLTKTVSKIDALRGETVVYTLTVTNDSTETATGVEVKDHLPSSVSYLSHTPGEDYFNGIWKIPTLPGGASQSLAITVRIN